MFAITDQPWLIEYRTAASNLGRLISTESCLGSLDFSYCDLDDSIWMTAEMCGGILMACVPTLGVLFFSRHSKSSSNPGGKGSAKLMTIGSAPTRSKKASLAQEARTIYSGTEDLYEERASMNPLTEDAAPIECLSPSSKDHEISRV